MVRRTPSQGVEALRSTARFHEIEERRPTSKPMLQSARWCEERAMIRQPAKRVENADAAAADTTG